MLFMSVSIRLLLMYLSNREKFNSHRVNIVMYQLPATRDVDTVIIHRFSGIVADHASQLGFEKYVGSLREGQGGKCGFMYEQRQRGVY